MVFLEEKEAVLLLKTYSQTELILSFEQCNAMSHSDKFSTISDLLLTSEIISIWTKHVRIVVYCVVLTIVAKIGATEYCNRLSMLNKISNICVCHLSFHLVWVSTQLSNPHFLKTNQNRSMFSRYLRLPSDWLGVPKKLMIIAKFEGC